MNSRVWKKTKGEYPKGEPNWNTAYYNSSEKENERTTKHLLWTHEGLLKDAECKYKKFLSAESVLVLHGAKLLGVEDWGYKSSGLGLC